MEYKLGEAEVPEIVRKYSTEVNVNIYTTEDLLFLINHFISTTY